MDRRNIQVLPVSSISQKSCIHTKNVFSLIDLSPEEEAHRRITKHINSCKICENELRKFQLQSLESKIHIPKPQIDTETKAIFEREVSEVFKAFDLNEKILLRKKIKNNIKKIDLVGLGFIKNLGSKNMIKTYAFATVLFIVLKQFFN